MKFSRFDKKSQYHETPHRTARLKGGTMVDFIFNTFFACNASASFHRWHNSSRHDPRSRNGEKHPSRSRQRNGRRWQITSYLLVIAIRANAVGVTTTAVGPVGQQVDSHFFAIRWAETIAASARLPSMAYII